MSTIYTKTGDKGTTALLDGSRVCKTSIFAETLGSTDELTTRIGLLCASLKEDNWEEVIFLRQIQANIQIINSYIACNSKSELNLPEIGDIDKELEVEIDRLETILPKLTKFILPGVTIPDAYAHSCRTQARCSEREVRGYQIEIGGLPDVVFRYLNRLSDYFFVLARWLCYQAGETDAFM